MTIQIKKFRFKPWHFALLFILLVTVSNLGGEISLKNIPEDPDSRINDLASAVLADSISEGMSYIFFYSNESPYCRSMEINLNKLAKEQGNGKFYKIDIDKDPAICHQYSIKGIPSVVVYCDGKEVSRIVGVVPVSNIKLINRKIGGI